MKKTFTGRVIHSQRVSAKALKLSEGLNTLESYLDNRRYLKGKIVCLPTTFGSTTGGMILQTMIQEGNGPLAFLFTQEIDPLASAGIILADIWNNKKVTVIDRIGDELLTAVRDGQRITVEESGEIILN